MKTFDLRELPEVQRVACYGTFFAMAAVDGQIDGQELSTIYEALDTSGMSLAAVEQVHGWMLTPPTLEQMLSTLSEAAPEVRFGVMVHLLDVALADDNIHPHEQDALDLARATLSVNDTQFKAIETFLAELRRVRDAGLPDADASQAVKNAATALSAVGVPVAAIYFSSTLGGLGLAGGLTALGLGLGLVPGVGMVMLMGVATYAGVSWALGRGAKRAPRLSREARLVANLEQAISVLVRIIDGDDLGEEDEREARSRLHALQRMLVRGRSLQQEEAE